MSDKLELLMSLCKCSVTVEINRHKDFYESVALYLSERDNVQDITKDVFDKMINTDTVVEIHFYPDTPIGFYEVFHWDLNSALNEALKYFYTKPQTEREE